MVLSLEPPQIHTREAHRLGKGERKLPEKVGNQAEERTREEGPQVGKSLPEKPRCTGNS